MWRVWKWKEKRTSRDLNPRFSVIFPPMIWIFMESEKPEIKSKPASKRDRTLFPSFLISQSLGYDQFSFLYVWARLTKVDPFGRVISCGAFFAFPFMIDLVVLKWADKQRFLPHEVCGLAHICPALWPILSKFIQKFWKHLSSNSIRIILLEPVCSKKQGKKVHDQ